MDKLDIAIFIVFAAFALAGSMCLIIMGYGFYVIAVLAACVLAAMYNYRRGKDA